MKVDRAFAKYIRELVDIVRALPTERERFSYWDNVMTPDFLEDMCLCPVLQGRMSLLRLYTCLNGATLLMTEVSNDRK